MSESARGATQQTQAYDKPLPQLDGLTKEFYAWCKQRDLRFQRCVGCSAWRHPPRELCAECGSWEWEWAQSSGRGSVFTWTLVARAMHPAFQHDAPYAAIVVELDEGVRLVSRVIDCPPDELEIGMPVEVTFEDVTPEIALPFFRRAG